MVFLAAGPGQGPRSQGGPEAQGEGQARDGVGLVGQARQGGGGSTGPEVWRSGTEPQLWRVAKRKISLCLGLRFLVHT